jgi:hypothetical protein
VAQYRVTLTVKTDTLKPSTWPDARIEVLTTVSILPEGPEEEIIGRVIGILVERLEAAAATT